jgi:hypothetical protein
LESSSSKFKFSEDVFEKAASKAVFGKLFSSVDVYDGLSVGDVKIFGELFGLGYDMSE